MPGALCQSALGFDVINVMRFAGMLKSAAKPTSPTDSAGKVVQLPLPRFVRPTDHLETLSPANKKEGG